MSEPLCFFHSISGRRTRFAEPKFVENNFVVKKSKNFSNPKYFHRKKLHSFVTEVSQTYSSSFLFSKHLPVIPADPLTHRIAIGLSVQVKTADQRSDGRRCRQISIVSKTDQNLNILNILVFIFRGEKCFCILSKRNSFDSRAKFPPTKWVRVFDFFRCGGKKSCSS